MKYLYIIRLLNKIKLYRIHVKLPKLELLLKMDVKTLHYLNQIDVEYLAIALNTAMENTNINCLSIIKSIKNNNYLDIVNELIHNKNINIKTNLYTSEAIDILQSAKCEYVANILKDILENPLIIFNVEDEDLALYYANFLLNYEDLNLLNYKILANIINDEYFIKNNLNEYFVKILDNTYASEFLENKKILNGYFINKTNFREFFFYILKNKPNNNIESKQYLLMIVNILSKFMDNINENEIIDYINKIYTNNFELLDNNINDNNINEFLKIYINYWKYNFNNELSEDDSSNLSNLIDNLTFLKNDQVLTRLMQNF